VVLLRLLDAAEGEILGFVLVAGRLADEGNGIITSASTCFTNHVSTLHAAPPNLYPT